MRLRLLALSVLCSAALLACETSADLGHNAPTDSGAGSEADASSKLPNGPEPTPPTVPDATLAEVQARCADKAHGAVDAYANFVELKKLLVRRWFACDRTEGRTDLYQREVGIQFRADGTWNLLRATPEGTFVDQHGIDNEGTWGEKYTGFTGYFQINLTSDMVLTQFAFESGPRRMRVTEEMTKAMTWFVPMGVETSTPHPR